MKDLNDFIMEELLLEGLGGPDYKRVSQCIQSLARQLHYEPFRMDCEDRLSSQHVDALWDLFQIYKNPPNEYEWIGDLSDGKRDYIANWALKILARQSFRFNDRELICKILDSSGKTNSVSPYAYLRDVKCGNSVSLELVRRAPIFPQRYTRTILLYLKRQHFYHVNELAALVPWLVTFLGLKPSGRGLSRNFHSDRSSEILLLFSELKGLKEVVINACEPLRGAKRKSVRVASIALLVELES